MTVWTYIIYLGISVAMTVWVAQTLFKHGRIFLVETFSGKEDLADSVNHLLVVGFYLINIGYVTLALQYGAKPADMASAIEVLSTKVGLVWKFKISELLTLIAPVDGLIAKALPTLPPTMA